MLENDAVFEAGRPVILSAGKTADFSTEIESFRQQHGRCIAKFRGVDSIVEAERWIGSEIRILAETLPAPGEGSFYTFQLKGCQVFAMDGEYIGIVTDVLDCGGNEILKYRYVIEFQNHQFGIDVFSGRHEGLILAEVEGESELTLRQLSPPAFVGRDVTDDPFFTGGALATVSEADLSARLAEEAG